MPQGLVFDIQRFSTHDGPGIRTTVFLKGCPLSCVWCHNPESQSGKTELFFHKQNCIDCGSCNKPCPWGNAREILSNALLRKKKCGECTLCAEVCASKAIEIVGKYYTSREIIDEIKKDSVFYRNSNGGITISGGEPLFQYDFTLDILKKAKKENIHTALETSGFTSTERILAIRPYVDLFLWDIKASDENCHKKYTGVSLNPIIRNLKQIDRLGAKTIIRLVMVPGINMNAGHYQEVIRICSGLKNIQGIELMPYHNYGVVKKEKLGFSIHKKFAQPTHQEIEEINLTLSDIRNNIQQEAAKRTSREKRRALSVSN